MIAPKTRTMARVSRRPKTVGLDRPCGVCEKPMHYTYSGPVEGVCGRCADKRRTKGVRAYHRGMVVRRNARKQRRSKASMVVLVCVLLVVLGVGAAVVTAVFRFMLG